jgi:nitrite reductase (NADH) small subunit
VALRRYVVAPAAEMPPGSRRIIEVSDRRKIGIFNVEGRFFAVRNVCPHMGAPLCLGQLTGTQEWVETDSGQRVARWTRDGYILRCPWHRWEFDITTGETVFHSDWRVRTYPVLLEESNGAQLSPDSKESVETYRVGVEGGVVVLEA